MSILGPLAGEPPEPMTREQFRSAEAVKSIARADRDDGQEGFSEGHREVIWLKRRLHRVENAIEPLVQEIRR